MISISDAVYEIVKQSPYLTEALSEKIVNLSALARKIHLQVEEKVKKDIDDGAIMAALKRIGSKLNKKYQTSLELRSAIRHDIILDQKKLFRKIMEFISRLKIAPHNFDYNTLFYHKQ